MATFLQIVLINLVVSVDNVGVIALAIRDLPQERAVRARRIGIWLTLLFKFAFIAAIGFLFGVSWLHIRILGGLLLLYVTLGMLRTSRREPGSGGAVGRRAAKDSFLLAIVTIVAADLSMSIDNTIAILSVVSADGSSPGPREMALVFAGVLISVPVLLWCSEAVARLMARFHLLVCLCAGYLAYLAVTMICEDGLIELLLVRIGLSGRASGTAALCAGALTALYGLLIRPESTPRARRRNGLLFICPYVLAYSVMSVVLIHYLATGPVIDGRVLDVREVYGFAPSAATAVLSLSAATEFPIACTAVLAGVLIEEGAGEWRFWPLLRETAKGLGLFLGIELCVVTLGLWARYGAGSMHPALYLRALAVQAALLLAYAAVFCLIGLLTRARAATVALSLAAVVVEFIAVEAAEHSRAGMLLAGLLPGAFLEMMEYGYTDSLFCARALLLCALLVTACALAAGLPRPTRRAAV